MFMNNYMYILDVELLRTILGYDIKY